MKNKLKGIIGNGLPYGLAIFGLSFILGYYSFNVSLTNTLWMAASLGLFTLLMNGLIYSRFSKPLKYLENISINVSNPELLLLEAPANHLDQDSLVPGKLFLTDRRMIFKPYEAGEDRLLLYSWDLANLTPTIFSGSLWNSGGEFLLKTKDEILLMFEVNKIKPMEGCI